MIHRRLFLLGSLALASGASAAPITPSPGEFERIRARLGPNARLGVGIFDTLSRAASGFDSDSRYPLASAFKLPLVAAVLKEAEADRRSLSDEIGFEAQDLQDHAPVVRRRLRRGRLSLRELCAAALRESDNSAANILLREIGGPGALNRFVRSCGDEVTRLDRYAPELNVRAEGDERDTTTPAAMAELTYRLVIGDVLSHESRARLESWLPWGDRRDRIRADFPPVGASTQVATAEIAMLHPVDHERVIVAIFLSGSDPAPRARVAAEAAVFRLVADNLNRAPFPAEPPQIN